MPEQTIRFGISDGSGRRSATWKVWTPTGKADVYLACRRLEGTLKASLHESGSWHVAYSQKAFEENVQGAIRSQNDRFLEQWPRPKPIAAGVTLAFRIVTPHSAVTSQLGEADKNITWLPNCPQQRATEIDILIISHSTLVTPGKNKMEPKPVGSYELENDESVWVVYWVVDLPNPFPAPAGCGQFYRGRTKEDLKHEGLRALVFGDEPAGSRVIHDCAVAAKAARVDRATLRCPPAPRRRRREPVVRPQLGR